MTPEQKQMLRDALAAALVTAAPLSLPLASLRQAARAAGFETSLPELETHLDYLVKKGLAHLRAETLSAGVRRWEATAAAVDYCEGAGLV